MLSNYHLSRESVRIHHLKQIQPEEETRMKNESVFSWKLVLLLLETVVPSGILCNNPLQSCFKLWEHYTMSAQI